MVLFGPFEPEVKQTLTSRTDFDFQKASFYFSYRLNFVFALHVSRQSEVTLFRPIRLDDYIKVSNNWPFNNI